MGVFKEWDNVKWSSQAMGFQKAKIGFIVQVVPAGEYPDRNKFPKLYSGAGVGKARDHESYVVAVDCGKTPGSSTRHYWPRVSALRMVGTTPQHKKTRLNPVQVAVLSAASEMGTIDYRGTIRQGGRGATLFCLCNRGFLVKRERIIGGKFWEITSEGKGALKMHNGDKNHGC